MSKWRTLRIRTPDCIDAERRHDDAPWQQQILFEAGTSNPLLARTALQVEEFLQQIFADGDQRRNSIFEIAFQVGKSLLSLERYLSRCRQEVDGRIELVSVAIKDYTQGQAPRPIRPILTIEDDFKAFALEVRQCLNHITDLFEPTIDAEVEPGRFDLARKEVRERQGEDSILLKMLEGDAGWIELWIAVANTSKHPKPNERLRVNDMRLLPDRKIQLPTWELAHPKHGLERPQALLESCDIVIQNLLGLFENLFVELIQARLPNLPAGMQWIIEDCEARVRNPDAPIRYLLRVVSAEAS